MSTPVTPTPPPSLVTKFETWAKAVEGEVKDALTHVFGDATASKIEAATFALLQSDLGPLALQATQAATDVVSGKVDVTSAVSILAKSSLAAGKAVAGAAATQLIAAAQTALQSPSAPPVNAPSVSGS